LLYINTYTSTISSLTLILTIAQSLLYINTYTSTVSALTLTLNTSTVFALH
jgi:hypothetical protein